MSTSTSTFNPLRSTSGDGTPKKEHGRFKNSATDSDVDLSLAAALPSQTAAAGWPVEPTTEQKIRAGAYALRKSMMTVDPRFDITAEQEKIAQRLARLEGCLNAYLTGEQHPDDRYFDELWSGDAERTSAAAVASRIDQLTEQRDEIAAGTAHSSLVIGWPARSGTSEDSTDSEADREMAVRMADLHLEVLHRAVETGGRSLELNQIWVDQHNKPF